MGKSEIKSENSVFQMILQEREKAKAAASIFYPDGIIAPFLIASKQNPFASLLTQAKALPASLSPTQEQQTEFCKLIRANVKQGKPENIEVQLNKGRQMFDGKLFPLGNTVVKLRIGLNDPNYFFIKAGDTLNASVFLSTDARVAIMLLEDENGDDYFLPLSEFQLLSLQEDPDPRKEVGLITSFVCLTSQVFTSILLAPSLDPIKNLLLSELLLAEWQRAQEALLQLDTEVTGGSTHE